MVDPNLPMVELSEELLRTTTTCADFGCTTGEGEWCDLHQVERYDCICGAYGTDTYCGIHGPLEETQVAGWLDAAYGGYPPDDTQYDVVETGNYGDRVGVILVPAHGVQDAHQASVSMPIGTPVQIDGGIASPAVDRIDGYLLEDTLGANRVVDVYRLPRSLPVR